MHIMSFRSLMQTSAVSRSEISKVHTELLQGVEDFLIELQARQEQQRIEEEEAARLKKIREEQVSYMDRHFSVEVKFSVASSIVFILTMSYVSSIPTRTVVSKILISSNWQIDDIFILRQLFGLELRIHISTRGISLLVN